jgi:glycosyltransferase involved in cell wall biosynthesis
MTRVVVLAYHFPPIGGAGSQRWLKFARYLPESGVTVRVVTGPGTTRGRWSPHDETLLEELAPGTEIRRLADPEPAPSGRHRARAERWLGLETAWSRWWREGVAREAVACAADADVVVASMSPFSSAAAAADVARRTGLPWIADLRDPWALDEMIIYPSALHRARELRSMGELLATSDAIVTTTSEAAARIRARFPLLATRPIESIPNGFDAGDFAGNPPPRDDGVFRIVHTGYLHTDVGEHQRRTARMRALLGGQLAGVDILTRSHIYLLEAIDEILGSDPTLAGSLELHLAGVVSDDDRRRADQFPFARVHGYVSHAEAIRLMRGADLLFLPMQKLPSGTRASIVPGKTYEYLAAGRPVLAAVPEGDARDILAEAGIARICEPDDVRGMAAAISDELARVRRCDPGAAIDQAVLQRFERRALAARFAALVEAVAEKGPRRSTGVRAGNQT